MGERLEDHFEDSSFGQIVNLALPRRGSDTHRSRHGTSLGADFWPPIFTDKTRMRKRILLAIRIRPWIASLTIPTRFLALRKSLNPWQNDTLSRGEKHRILRATDTPVVRSEASNALFLHPLCRPRIQIGRIPKLQLFPDATPVARPCDCSSAGLRRSSDGARRARRRCSSPMTAAARSRSISRPATATRCRASRSRVPRPASPYIAILARTTCTPS